MSTPPLSYRLRPSTLVATAALVIGPKATLRSMEQQISNGWLSVGTLRRADHECQGQPRSVRHRLPAGEMGGRAHLACGSRRATIL